MWLDLKVTSRNRFEISRIKYLSKTKVGQRIVADVT